MKYNVVNQTDLNFRDRQQFTIERYLLSSFVKSIQNYIIVFITALCIFKKARLTCFVLTITGQSSHVYVKGNFKIIFGKMRFDYFRLYFLVQLPSYYEKTDFRWKIWVHHPYPPPPPKKKCSQFFLLGVPFLPPDLCYTEGETLDELLCSLEELNKKEVQMTKNNIYIKAKTLNSGGIYGILVDIFFVKSRPIFQKPLVNTMHKLREQLQTKLLSQTWTTYSGSHQVFEGKNLYTVTLGNQRNYNIL